MNEQGESIRHWHILTPDDDGTVTTYMDNRADHVVTGLADALDYAADYLEMSADHLTGSAHGHAMANDYERAWHDRVNADTVTGHVANLRNAHKQLTGPHGDLAPLYRMEWDREGERHARMKAREHTMWLISDLATNNPVHNFGIWECNTRCDEYRALDTVSSASRQHYIDTGQYLEKGEAETEPTVERRLTLDDLP